MTGTEKLARVPRKKKKPTCIDVSNRIRYPTSDRKPNDT